LFGRLALLAGADSGYFIRLNALGALRNVFLGASQQDLELDARLAMLGFKALCDAIGDRTMQLTSDWKWTILKAIYQPLTRVGDTQLQLYKEELETSGAVEEIEHLQNVEGNVKVSDWSSKIYELVNAEADENDFAVLAEKASTSTELKAVDNKYTSNCYGGGANTLPHCDI
jgi:hypothetical protein